MPSRNWHSKSKLGCLQCRQRRIKCDQSRPICANCVRSSSSCTYSHGANSSADAAAARNDSVILDVQALRTANAAYSKRWHSKSRNGCYRCKERRIKCDEASPTCMKCSRIGATCVYSKLETFESTAVECSARPAPIPPRMIFARMRNSTDAMAFEYFLCNCLPMLQICQPSSLWKSLITFSSQTYETIRFLAVALGFQQRLIEDGKISAATSPSDATFAQSDVFYGNCIGSLRKLIETVSPDDAPIVALCCVLLVALEGLRDSPKNLLLHLHNSVGIISNIAHRGDVQKSNEIRDIVSLLQHLCVSAWMSITSPSYDGDYALILQDLPFDKLCYLVASDSQGSHSLEIHNMVGEIIYNIRRLMHPETTSDERTMLFDSLYKLRARTRFFRYALISQEARTAGRNFLEAKAVITGVYLDAMLIQPRNTIAEKAKIGEVLDLLQEAITELNSSRDRLAGLVGPHPFSVGTGSLYILENILWNSHDDGLEHRALGILQQCPLREGLWTKERILRSYYAKKYATTRKKSVPRLTVATTATDHLTTPGDTVEMAVEMLKNLRVEE